MAHIEEIVNSSTDRFCSTIQLLKKEPAALQKIFAPLTEAGFEDFVSVANGTDGFLVSPSDNEQIVFKISTDEDFATRHDNCPFLLASPYTRSTKGEPRIVTAGNVSTQERGARYTLEMLLRGKPVTTEEQRSFLLSEMQRAGWKTQHIDGIKPMGESRIPGLFWKDVIVVPMRMGDGRMKQIPIISDPSSSQYWLNAAPWEMNVCSPDYPSLQDQAAAYNAVIERDARLKKLAPEPIELRETTILPTEPRLEEKAR